MISQSKGYDPASHLSLSDLSVDRLPNPSLIQFTLKSSKTDPFRRGVKVVVGKSGDDICPVVAMLAYLAVRGKNPGPLFQHADHQPFTRPQFVREIKASLQKLGYPPSQFAGHSFRAGAATAAAAVGIEDSVIKVLGRWESTAYQSYVRLPRSSLGAVSQTL